jgi:hypothetical protein
MVMEDGKIHQCSSRGVMKVKFAIALILQTTTGQFIYLQSVSFSANRNIL